jgi:hypothetical protein
LNQLTLSKDEIDLGHMRDDALSDDANGTCLASCAAATNDHEHIECTEHTSELEQIAKNLFSGTLLTRTVVGFTGTGRAAAAGDGAKVLPTVGARRSASELRVEDQRGYG